MRGVQIKDVASSFTSEPGVLTINVDHIRFKSAPSADGDGYRMETPLDQIPREPEARRMGGTLGGLWTPYFIELPRRRSPGEEATLCQLIFGTNQTACAAVFAKLQELVPPSSQTARPEYFCMRLNANTITGTSGVGVSLSNLLTTKMKYIIGDMSTSVSSRWVGGCSR